VIMELLLGIDVGTTGTKTLLIDTSGKEIAAAYRPYGFTSGQKDFVEQDPDDWWNAVVECVNECSRDFGDKIAALSVSSQGATLTPVLNGCVPACDAITWMDSRAEKQGKELNDKYGVDYFYDKTGWKIANCFNLPQIMWMKENNTELFDSVYKFLSTIEYINYKLTGSYAIDQTNAGITQLYNIRELDWDEDILGMTGVSRDRLPDVYKTGSVIGNLTAGAAKALGLSEDVVVVSGAQDQYAAAVGSGALSHGDVLLSCGTSWCITSVQEEPFFDYSTYFAVARCANEKLWASFGYTPTGGAAMEWVRSNIRLNDGSLISYDERDRLADEISPGAEGLLFLPHFAGMQFPRFIPGAKANLVGLGLRHTGAHILRAMMEGSIYDMKYMLDSIQESGAKINRLKALGGATKSSVWMQLAADILDMEITIPSFADIPALGAAIIAGYGAGIFPTLGEGYARMRLDTTTLKPRKENSGLYQECYNNFIDVFSVINRR